jgi:hypothetical protein
LVKKWQKRAFQSAVLAIFKNRKKTLINRKNGLISDKMSLDTEKMAKNSVYTEGSLFELKTKN